MAAGRRLAMIVAAGHGPSALWYATRGAGAMTLVLLTASIVLGIGETRNWRLAGAPRFAVASLHRTLSLLALALLVVHVLTTVLDPFPAIGLGTAVLPFATDYRPLWMGLGTIGSDLLLALVVTSLLRRRLGYPVWRTLHWLAYACWPVAILHGLGTGSDTQSGWMLVLTLACVAAVGIAVVGRLAAPGTPSGARVGGAALATLSALGLAIWLTQGPLASGWARRAGTPATVLAAFAPKPPVAPARRTPADALARPFTADVVGTIDNGFGRDGSAVADLTLRLRGGPAGVLRIRLAGQAVPGGGLQMNRSAVTLGPPADPKLYSGRIDFLQASQLRALVGSPGGHTLQLVVDLSLGSRSVSGRVRATPAVAGGV